MSSITDMKNKKPWWEDKPEELYIIGILCIITIIGIVYISIKAKNMVNDIIIEE